MLNRCVVHWLFLIFLFTFSAHLRAQSRSLFSFNKIEDVNGALAEKKLYGVENPQYDGAYWSGLAGLETWQYPWPFVRWDKIQIDYPTASASLKHRYYTGKVPAHFHQGTDGKLFIFFGTSFTGFDRGTWTSKLTYYTLGKYPQSSILFFPGYLSEETLEVAGAPFPDPSLKFIARDYLIRIVSFLNQKKKEGIFYNKIGTIGSSGGATIALRIQEEERRFRKLKNWPQNLFSWGNLALSPVVDPATACRVTDAQANFVESKAGFSKSYSIYDWVVLKKLFGWFPGVVKATVPSLLKLSRTPQHKSYVKFRDLVVYNAIQEIELLNKYQSPDYTGEHRFTPYYESYSFNKIKALYPEYKKFSYDDFATMRTAAQQIDRPNRVVFSLDDPLLSAPVLLNLPMTANPRVTSILEKFRRNSNFKVDQFPHGGHLGYYIDSDYFSSLFEETFR